MRDILLSGDSNVLPYLSVVMESAVNNLEAEPIFHVMYPSSDAHSEQILTDLSHYYSLVMYPIEDQLVKPLSSIAGKRWPGAAFFPLFAAQILPNSLERILVLDSDVLVVDNIDQLFELSFDGKALMATSSWIKGLAETYKPRSINYDFNSGLYMINLEKWRRMDVDIDFWVKTQKSLRDKGLTLFDQDLLNEAFSVQETKYLNKSYNVNPHMYSLAQSSSEFEGRKVLHFTNNNGYFVGKPWDMLFDSNDVDDSDRTYYYKIDENIVSMVSEWWRAAEGTIYYDDFLMAAKIRKNFYKKRSLAHFKNESHLAEENKEWKNLYKVLSDTKYKGEVYMYNSHNSYPTMYNLKTFLKRSESGHVEFVRTKLDNNYIVIPIPLTLTRGDKVMIEMVIRANSTFDMAVFLREHHKNKQLLSEMKVQQEFMTFTIEAEIQGEKFKDLALMWDGGLGSSLTIREVRFLINN